MAPPPPANLPTMERLKALAKTLQFTWFCGHFLLILSVARYLLANLFFNANGLAARVSYRLAFVFAAVTYGIVVYKAHFSHGWPALPVQQLAVKLAGDENVQYLAMAIVWLYARQIVVALFPFTIYSIFHVASYSRSYLLPTLSPPKDATTTSSSSSGSAPSSPSSGSPKTPSSPMIDRITRFIKTYHDASMSLVATFELLLLLRLALTALTFSRGSWVLLAVYALFFRGRYENNMFVQGAVAHWTARIDAALSHQGTPPVVRRAWELGKAYTRRAYEVLDVKRYLGGRAGAARKAQ